MGRNRRMSKVYAFVLAYGEAWMYLNMTRLMCKRLARERLQPPLPYRRAAEPREGSL